ncbi:hypothetical protein BDV23DRAFT_183025 [Aspergillus alliaceus]|uniref:Nucleosome assembly protein n=1 Tax=Petromyces alliaceus TaxID=209559 RepID=A0A5N7C9U7_PETAA|nr:hypothetical protein BDV23DRAFT_183025 [Aspergillus alliaceus]
MPTPPPTPPTQLIKTLYTQETTLNTTWTKTLHEARKAHHETNTPFYKHRSQQATGYTNDTCTHTPLIEDFWLLALRKEPSTRKAVTKPDIGPLKALTDIRIEWGQGFDYVLEFQFAANEYFTNRVMRKAFIFEAGDAYPYPVPVETRGEDIYWRKNHILQAECHARIGARSFFAWLSRSVAFGDGLSSEEEGFVEERLGGDFDLGEAIRDRVHPNAMSYHLGGLGEEEEEEEDDDSDYDMEW